jgi:N-formylglutamate amidohydrolase
MAEGSFELRMPTLRTTSVVFASPHSGRDYPAHFLRSSVLGKHAIRSSEDAFVDTLLQDVPTLGAPLLTATVPRAYVDLNRAAEELDPALIDGVRRTAHNPRVTSGLGVVPRVVANGRAIYRGKLSLLEAELRIRRYWRPYHAQLQTLLDGSLMQFGEAILIDFHSMPHEAIDGVAPPRGRRPSIVLGDRFGASADPAVVDAVEHAFEAAGLAVTRNAPFAGAYTAQHYGRPSRRQHVVQVEVDRALYMDEEAIRPLPQFDAFRRLLTGICAEIVRKGASEMPLAAE